MFVFGLIVTGMTLSVSLSLTILVPLTLKGYVKRDSIIPYVMGANIATWIDTLFAALLLDKPRAFTIVFVEMITGATVSLIVLVLFYEPYKRLILHGAHLATRDRRGFAVFLGAVLSCRRCCCLCERLRLRDVGSGDCCRTSSQARMMHCGPLHSADTPR